MNFAQKHSQNPFYEFIIFRGIDVHRHSGDIGPGGHYSGDLPFAKNNEPGAGKDTDESGTGFRALGENEAGGRSFNFVAGSDWCAYAALEKRSGSIYIRWYWSRIVGLDYLLGLYRISKI